MTGRHKIRVLFLRIAFAYYLFCPIACIVMVTWFVFELLPPLYHTIIRQVVYIRANAHFRSLAILSYCVVRVVTRIILYGIES